MKWKLGGNLNVRTGLRLHCLGGPGIRCSLEKSLEAKLMGVQPDRDVDPLLIPIPGRHESHVGV